MQPLSVNALSVNEIRERFLSFFEARGHLRLPSFPLVPQNDNSLLLINAGMAPLKPYFTGQEVPPNKRVVTCQKCIRTNDIDEVGDAHHSSCFEMLGNFSFGEYFKKEAIPWVWAFITEDLQIPRDRLYITIYEEDDEAHDIWLNDVGIPEDRIVRLGKKDNFWELDVGPCGPDSEIHFDWGEAHGCGRPDCKVGCDCDRFLELGNLVFTQFNKKEDGGYEPLKTRNIDVGVGLERLAVVLQQADSLYEIDTMRYIQKRVRGVFGFDPGRTLSSAQTLSINIITDHIRSVTFLAADGVLPSNEGRGYVMRRLLRRAVRHGQRIAGREFWLARTVAGAVIDVYGGNYPELKDKSEHIMNVLFKEEERFKETLDAGMALLRKKIETLHARNETRMSGADAFTLYDTYGFPLELTQEILADEAIFLDKDGFAAEMENQKQRARQARHATNYLGAEETVYHQLPPGLSTVFMGYTDDTAEAEVIALVTEDGGAAEEAGEGRAVSVFLNRTPFYAESGGQKGDAGVLYNEDTEITIWDCVKVAGGNTAHRGVVTRGTVRLGGRLTAAIDTARRLDTARHHTATHLLQKALREVLGAHVEQAGSEVSADRLRFDFTHFGPLSPQDRLQVETRVNEWIMTGYPVQTEEMPIDKARKKGAMALFGEKYGDTVRVVDIGGVSLELCGGTHLRSTQTAGLFKLLSESGVAAGVRRIEAVAGPKALAYFRGADAKLQEVSAILKTTPDHLAERAAAVAAEVKQLQRELARVKAEAAGAGEADRLREIWQTAAHINGFTVQAARADGLDAGGLRAFCDKLRDKLDALILCSVNQGAVQFIASVSDAAVKKGAHAGLAVKEAAAVCGGGGGGRPNTAQAGGKDAAKADEALQKALDVLKGQLA